MGIRVLIKGLDKVIEFPTNTKLPDIENSIKVNWNEVESFSGLPMDTASRMERAQHLGFDVDNKAFHGTDDADFGEFDLDRFAENYGTQGEPGIYTTGSRAHAENYGGEIKELLINSRDYQKINMKEQLKEVYDSFESYQSQPFDEWVDSMTDIEAFEALDFDNLIGNEARSAKQGGYPGVVADFSDIDGLKDVTLSFESKNLRDIDAEFNPAKGSSSNLLASSPVAATATSGALGLLGLGGLLQPQSAEAKAKANEQPYKEGDSLFTLDQAKGALDVLATFGSGLVGMSVGGLTGIATGDPGAIDPVAQAFTRQPSTDAGKEIIQKLMPILGSVDAVNQFLSKTAGDAAWKAGSQMSPEVGAAAGAGAKALVELFSPI